MGQHEGSHLAGVLGVTGGVAGMEYLLEQGAGGVRENLRAKNAGLSPAEVERLRVFALEQSKAYPSLSALGIREQGRLLIPNVGDFDASMKVLPEYMKGQVAMQTMSGPGEGGKDMEAFARYIDIIGRSMSVEDTRKLIDGYVRARQLDPEAIKATDYVNAAKSAASPGKGLSVGFWSKVAPALFSQQGGARSGTDIASAYQNFMIGRGTDASVLAQYDEGLRNDFKFRTKKNGQRQIIQKGGLVDEDLYGADPYEWAKKHLVPKMVAKGMLPEGYAKGDYSQDLTDKQRQEGGKYLSGLFSNRRGANIFSMMIQDMDQLEKFFERWSKTKGTADVLKDMRQDPYVVANATKTQAGSVASALSTPGMPDLVANLDRINNALGGFATKLEQNPNAAQTVFGVGAAAVGGAAAAGVTALTLAAVGTLSLPALVVGTIAALTIGALTLPWPAIAKAAGAEGVSRKIPDLVNDQAYFEDANDWTKGGGGAGKGGGSKGRGLIGHWFQTIAESQQQLGQAAQAAAGPTKDAAGGMEAAKNAASGAGGAFQSAAAGLSSLVGAARAVGGAAGGGVAPGGGGRQPNGAPALDPKIKRGASYAPPARTQVAGGPSTIVMDGRVVGKVVERRQVAEHAQPNGLAGFDNTTMPTPGAHQGMVIA